MENELISLAKRMKLLGKEDLCQKIKLSIAKETKTNSDKSDLSYSYICRELRKNDKDKLKEVQKEFKKVFDDAFLEGLENPQEIALLHIIKKFNV